MSQLQPGVTLSSQSSLDPRLLLGGVLVLATISVRGELSFGHSQLSVGVLSSHVVTVTPNAFLRPLYGDMLIILIILTQLG